MTGVSSADVANVAVRLPTAVFLAWLLYTRFVARRPLPSIVRLPVKVVGFLILVLTLGLLVGCTISDSHLVAYLAEVASEVSV
jgi:hypothetical protein